jgi:DNA (cytosine-5)-methyltransferase 1
MSLPKAISLFSGAGGDTEGLTAAGYNVVAYSENNAAAIATHQARFPDSVLLKDPATGSTDIRKIPDSVFTPYAGQIIALFAGFPCFVAGTQVLTHAGYKPIETVALTDTLMTHTGKFQRIVNLQRKLVPAGTPLHSLRVKYHPRPIIGTEEHPFYVRTRVKQTDNTFRFDAPHWKPFRELTSDDFCGIPLPPPTSDSISLETRVLSLTEAYEVQREAFCRGRIVSIDKLSDTEYSVSEVRDAASDDAFIDSGYAWMAPHTLSTLNAAEPTTVYNFEVAEDNSYIVENTIVHNCQGFSHAGKKRSDDPRNELVYEFARVARLVRPAYIIGENVSGLLSRKGRDSPTAPLRPVIEIIRDLFAAAGYRITYRVIPAIDVGVPQRRKRLLIVGLRSNRFWPHIDWPAAASPTALPTIRHILEPHLEGALPAPVTATAPDPRFWIETTHTAPTGTPHPNLVRLAGGIRNLSSKERAVAPAGAATTIIEPGGLLSFGTRSSSYHGEIVDPDAPSKTIICTYGLCPRLFVGLRNPTTGQRWIRCMTPRELGQVQGFPADYPWTGDTKAQITQIGNAVPPALATFVGNAIKTVRRSLTPQVATEDTTEDTDSDSDAAD